jgi:hypothetical protein
MAISIGGVEFAAPEITSYALALDLYAAAEQGHRGAGALVGWAWTAAGAPKRPKAQLKRGDWLTYGGDVIDDLLSRGVPLTEVADAAMTILRESVLPVVARMPTTADVESAEGNSEAGGAG